MIAAFAALLFVSCRGPAADAPAVLDDRLEIALVASDPEIVTPIGLAADEEGRLFVLESHSHVRPSEYEGPEGDVVKILEDLDGDGRLDVSGIFTEGFEDGMNLAFSPDGVLHLVTSRSVWALHDRDGDEVCDDRVRLLHMDRPEYVYDHAGLMGITFSSDGWMYVSRGNVGGRAWRMTGTDGSSLDGYGDGGNVVRARLDGSELQEFATGFWNPFHIFVDSRGRLMATDNDPDSRGPNRLLHVIERGNYGYESLYGGSGIHPYLAWNGELPGTLPYAAGLGEAPTGCIELDRAAFPVDADETLLCAIWEESALVRVRLYPRGISVQGEVDPLVRGDSQFRPVAMATTGDGSIYITDWVIRRYPLHGRGRIWRLRMRSDNRRDSDRHAAAGRAVHSSRLEEIQAAGVRGDFSALREALDSSDPFLRSAAVTALARPDLREQTAAATEDPDADVRLGALLALRLSGHPDQETTARRLLFDRDPRVRRMALIWIGKAGMTSLRFDLERAADRGLISSDLYPTYLATIRHLDPSFIAAYRNQRATSSHDLERALPEDFIASTVADTSRPAELRAAALVHLENPTEQFDLLASLVRDEAVPLRRSAVRMLARSDHPSRAKLLLEVAEESEQPAELRADAVLGLSHGNQEVSPARVAALLRDSVKAVRIEAARFLRGVRLSEEMREHVADLYTSTGRDDARLRAQLARILEENPNKRPHSVEEWAAAIGDGGDPDVGRRVFFWPRSQCSLCHRVDGVGGDLGPDLTHAGASKNRSQLIRAVVDPSAEVAPDWQGWYVRTSDGSTHYGRQIDVGSDGVELYILEGRFVEFEDARDWGVAETSLMPDRLESVLTVPDFRDLIAFLEQSK